MNETDKVLVYWQPLLAGAGFLLGVVLFFLKRTLVKFEESQAQLSKSIGDKIDLLSERNDKQMAKLADDQSNLEKEFYAFKENVAKNYTKQEDFSSQTRDINKKLDNISAGMNKIFGQLSKGVG